MILASWAGKTLEVSGSKIEGFDTLSYYAEAVTEDKEKSDQQYKAFKLAGARTINVTVLLRSALGVDVKAEIDDWMKLLEDGKKAKFYVSGTAITDAEFILTTVRCDQVQLTPGGKWKCADMTLEFSQTGSGGSSSGSSSSGSSSSSSSGSKKTSSSSGSKSSGSSAKKTSTTTSSSKTSSTTSSTTGIIAKAAEAAKTIQKNAQDAAKRASKDKISTSSKSSIIMKSPLLKLSAIKK